MMPGEALYRLCAYAVWFFVYAFAGWVWELVYSLAKHRRLINRGFFLGPILPIYGVGGLVAVVVLAPIDNPAVQFVVGCTLAALCEYATSWALEKIFHARWWDYSDMRFNLNGRICLSGIVLFGAMMLVVAHVVQPVLAHWTAFVPPLALEVAAGTLVAVFAADMVVSILRMRGLDVRLERLQELLGEIASGARQAAQDMRSAMADAMEDARLAMGDARETLADDASRARARVAGALEESRETLDAKLKAALDQPPKTSWLERRAIKNPYFKPVRNGEAYEWLRRHAAKGRHASKRRGGE